MCTRHWHKLRANGSGASMQPECNYCKGRGQKLRSGSHAEQQAGSFGGLSIWRANNESADANCHEIAVQQAKGEAKRS